MAELASGQSLASRFTLIRPLGRGGMGEVWVARDESLGTQVVTKIVPPGATSEQIALLRQECRNARRLSHPNIVRVFDFHEDPAAVFISMEHVEGGDVTELRGRAPQEILASLRPLTEALEYAHGEGVVHRDLKSSNVLLDRSGRPRLSDFGIAGVMDPEPEDLVLRGGGSRNHASPQQMAGEPASPADDVFGLGVLLTEILGSSPTLPEPLRALLQSMMAPAVEDRPAHMMAVREALDEIVALEVEEGTVAPQVVNNEIRLSPPPRVADVRPTEPEAFPPSAAFRDTESPSRHPYWWLTVTAFLTLAAVAAGVFVVLPKWVEERESRPVPVERAAAPDSVEVARPPSPSPPRVETGNGSMAPMAESLPPVEKSTVIAPEKERPRVTQPSVESPRPPKMDPGAREFAAAMSAGLRAFEGGDLVVAKGAFERALALAPGSAEAADGLARTKLALRLEEIRDHQAKARAFEGEERWR